MIRSGDGKMKGKRNRRRAKSQFYVWRRIEADVLRGDWRYRTRLFVVDDTPRTIQFSDIQDAFRW